MDAQNTSLMPKAKLSDIIDAIELQFDTTACYLDKSTGDIITLTDEELAMAEENEPLEDHPLWQQDTIHQARKVLEDTDDMFPSLPTKFDIHEYRIMEAFCLSVPRPSLSDELCYVIRGRGAFRRFKDCIHRHGIAEEWYHYRRQAFRKIAIEWCQVHQVAYVDDTSVDDLSSRASQTGATIRRATELDANALAYLNQRFNDEATTPEEMATRLTSVLATETVLVAEVEGHVVGFACLQTFRSVCYAAPWAELTELYVDVSYRRRGIGRSLVSHAEQLAQRQGVQEMVLRTGADNGVGQRFYRSLGYQVQDDQLMEKHLHETCDNT